MTLDGETVSEVPIKQKYKSIDVVCDNEATGEWDTEKWGVTVTNINNVKTKCAINFETLKKVNVTIHGAVQETIRLSDGQTIATDASGIGTAEVNVGESYTLTGSVSGYTSEEQIINSETTDLYAMPKGSLYWYGNLCSDVTGGWNGSQYKWNYGKVSCIDTVYETNQMKFNYSTGYQVASGTNNPISLDGYSNIKVTGYSDKLGIGLYMSKDKLNRADENNSSISFLVLFNSNTSATYTLNNPLYSYDYAYISFNTGSTNNTMIVQAVWLE